MRVLLIDDKAKNGWEQLLRKLFPIKGIDIISALTLSEALEQINYEFDIIFLDIRLDANDHKITKVEEFSGFKLLKEINGKFDNINFSTPIILFTASNKIWNIDAFRSYGADAYYIKEHPDYVFDKATSKQNYINFREKFNELTEIGSKRKEIWKLINKIIKKIDNHYYFNGDNRYVNVKNRINDKLKLGYVYLFKEQTLLEKKLLKTNNESLAFIIFWSILEEITKGFSDLSSWNSHNYERNLEWKFRNKEYFIEKNRTGIQVNISKNNKKIFVQYENTESEYEKYSYELIFLSEQIYSLLSAYTKDDQIFSDLSNDFRMINSFRNKVDFIHSDVNTIFTKELIRKEALTETNDNCKKVLKFINKVLKLI